MAPITVRSTAIPGTRHLDRIIALLREGALTPGRLKAADTYISLADAAEQQSRHVIPGTPGKSSSRIDELRSRLFVAALSMPTRSPAVTTYFARQVNESQNSPESRLLAFNRVLDRSLDGDGMERSLRFLGRLLSDRNAEVRHAAQVKFNSLSPRFASSLQESWIQNRQTLAHHITVASDPNEDANMRLLILKQLGAIKWDSYPDEKSSGRFLTKTVIPTLAKTMSADPDDKIRVAAKTALLQTCQRCRSRLTLAITGNSELLEQYYKIVRDTTLDAAYRLIALELIASIDITTLDWQRLRQELQTVTQREGENPRLKEVAQNALLALLTEIVFDHNLGYYSYALVTLGKEDDMAAWRRIAQQRQITLRTVALGDGQSYQLYATGLRRSVDKLKKDIDAWWNAMP